MSPNQFLRFQVLQKLFKSHLLEKQAGSNLISFDFFSKKMMHKNSGLISQFFYFYSNFFISQSEYMNLLLCWKISCFAVGLLSCWVKMSSAPAKLIETIVSLSIFNFLTYFHYPTISQLNYFLYLHLNLVIIIFKFYHSKSLKNSLIKICVVYISIKICEK